MVVSIATLDKRICSAVTRVAADYGKKTRGEEGSRKYLTENDVVCNLYGELRASLPRGYEVHSGLRPYHTSKKGKEVLRFLSKEWTWEATEGKNKGTTLDLCVLDSVTQYWRKAKKEGFWDNDDLKYWRFPSYPISAIRAAIEVKIRVRGKTSNIRKDIDKVKAIKTLVGSKPFLGYVVILDSCARPKDINGIKKKVIPEEQIRIIANGRTL